MNKKEKHLNDLLKLIKIYFDKNDKRVILEYLTLNSNLPGRRANIELANAFADIISDVDVRFFDNMWELCLYFVSFTPDIAPTNDPKEFLAFCGTWAIGSIGSSDPAYYQKSLTILKKLSNDPRWRIREAVAFGLQQLLIRHYDKVLPEMKKLVEENNWLTLRSIVAGVAHPSVLIDNKISEIALEIHKTIFSKIISAEAVSSEDFKILKKGLSYTLSVIICAIPEKGFKFLSEYINVEDKHIQMIIRENLKKNRLTKNFPKEVDALKKKLKF